MEVTVAFLDLLTACVLVGLVVPWLFMLWFRYWDWVIHFFRKVP